MPEAAEEGDDFDLAIRARQRDLGRSAVAHEPDLSAGWVQQALLRALVQVEPDRVGHALQQHAAVRAVLDLIGVVEFDIPVEHRVFLALSGSLGRRSQPPRRLL